MYNNNSTRTSVPMTAAASATAHGRPCCAHSALPSRLQPTFSLPRGYSRYTCILYYIYIYVYIYTLNIRNCVNGQEQHDRHCTKPHGALWFFFIIFFPSSASSSSSSSSLRHPIPSTRLVFTATFPR